MLQAEDTSSNHRGKTEQEPEDLKLLHILFAFLYKTLREVFLNRDDTGFAPDIFLQAFVR